MIKKADTTKLAKLLAAHTPYDGEFALRLAGVYAARASQLSTENMYGLQEPSACIVACGAKNVLIGEDIYEYQAGKVAVYSVDVPLSWAQRRGDPHQVQRRLSLGHPHDPRRLGACAIPADRRS